MPRVLLIVAVLALAFYVVSIVDVAVQPPNRHRGVSKTTWIAIVILLPVLGGALWFVVGRSRPSRLKLTLAPDDDPEFLGRVGGGSFSDQDERIRRLEEELAMLDSEGEDPPKDTGATGPKTGDSDAADPDSDGPRRGSIG